MIEIERSAFPGGGSETLIFFIYEGDLQKNDDFTRLDQKTKGRLLQRAKLHEFQGKRDQRFTLDEAGESIIAYGIGKKEKLTPASFRECVASAIRIAASLKAASVRFFYPQGLKEHEEAGRAIALGFRLAEYRFDKYKGKKGNKHEIKKLSVCVESDTPPGLQKGIDQGEIIARAVSLTRDLVNEPASSIHPEALAREAQRIANASKGSVTVEVLEKKDCESLGMGAFLGVAEGSERPPKFIVLTYTPKKPSGKTVCFVGKSITFDSGGLSLKPSKAMEDMKIDMSGGASVLGVFQALAEGIAVNRKVVGIMPACENMPSGRAMRPGDVVTALNGKTIEVLNTDAEGRLALADAVAYAEKTVKPDLIIDFATLTGACMVALGEDIAGVFGNSGKAVKQFVGITEKEGEPAWEMPFFKPYLEQMKSDIADLKNVSGKGYGGAITAALFIGEFVKNTDWIHVDIAGPAHNTGRPHGITPRGGTGWGVISIISLLQQA